MINPMMMSLMQGANPQMPSVAPTPPPAAPQPQAGGFQSFMNNPMTMMGMGLLGGNYGRNSKAAFSNAMMGGLQGMQMAQMAGIRNKKLKREEEEAKRKLEEYERMQKAAAMQAKALGLDPNMFVDASGVRDFAKMQQGPAAQRKAQWLSTPEALESKAKFLASGGTPDQWYDMFGAGGTNVKVDVGGKGERSPYLTKEEKIQGGFDIEQPMVWGKDGLPKTVKATGFTEGQLQAANFADRMHVSEQGMKDLEVQGFEPGQLLGHIAGEIPIVGNAALTPMQQQHLQMTRDWIRAKLRKESGAVINPDEWTKEYETYFPMPFDSPETIERKRKSREVATRGMVRMSGGAYKPPEVSPTTTPTDDDPLGLR